MTSAQRSEGFALSQRWRNAQRIFHDSSRLIRLLCTRCRKKEAAGSILESERWADGEVQRVQGVFLKAS